MAGLLALTIMVARLTIVVPMLYPNGRNRAEQDCTKEWQIDSRRES